MQREREPLHSLDLAFQPTYNKIQLLTMPVLECVDPRVKYLTKWGSAQVIPAYLRLGYRTSLKNNAARVQHRIHPQHHGTSFPNPTLKDNTYFQVLEFSEASRSRENQRLGILDFHRTRNHQFTGFLS